MMKVFQSASISAILLAAPALAASIPEPSLRTIEEGDSIRFAGAPMDGVTLPARAGEPHTCGHAFYPAMELRWHNQGDALLQFIIKPDGHIAESRLTQSSGHPRLDAAGLACVAQWTYIPAMKDGRAVAALNTVKVQWRIRNN